MGGEVARRMGRSRFGNLAALSRELAAPPPLPRVGLARATIFRQLRRLTFLLSLVLTDSKLIAVLFVVCLLFSPPCSTKQNETV